MQISGLKIITCPYCTQRYEDRTISSYNTFGSKTYSDGCQKGDWIPNMPSLVKCVNVDCGKFFYITNAKVIKEFDLSYFFSEDFDNKVKEKEFENTYPIASYKIGTKELEEALEINFPKNKDEEIKIRMLLLRRYNDIVREDRNISFSSDEKEGFSYNGGKLIEFYKDETTINGKLFLAELYREKGDFSSCIDILENINDEDKNEKTFKEKIYSQAKLKDDRVFDVNAIAIKKEYKCNNCGDSIILFDLEKNDSARVYMNFHCKDCNHSFNDAKFKENTQPSYNLNFFQRVFKLKKPYDYRVANEAQCTKCKSRNVEEINLENHVCYKCNSGKYNTVEWFKKIKT